MALDPAGLIGARIDDRYYLLRVLGEGSFGTVYAAEERFGEAVLGAVAVKLLRPRTAAERASVVVEMGAMAQLSHPNLLSYRSSGEVTSGPSAGCLYIAMELASNSLKERLGKLTLQSTALGMQTLLFQSPPVFGE